MIKLVISDLDGTLIDSTEQLPSEAFELADYLRAKQIMFSLASGRVYELAQPFADALKIQIPFITSNGAAITWRGNRQVARYCLPFAPFAQLIRKCDQMGLSIYYSFHGYEHIHRRTPFVCSQQEKTARTYSIVPLTDSDLASAHFEKLSLMDGDETGIIAEIEQMVNAIDYPFTYTRYVNRAIEIVAAGRTKAQGVRDLTEVLGISMREVLCIGDDANDVEMLTDAGIGVAVSNALPEAKACADYIALADHARGALEAVIRNLESDTLRKEPVR